MEQWQNKKFRVFFILTLAAGIGLAPTIPIFSKNSSGSSDIRESSFSIFSSVNLLTIAVITACCLLFLIPFIMAFCTLINAARFVQAEMLIHHAVTQTGKQISTYSYSSGN